MKLLFFAIIAAVLLLWNRAIATAEINVNVSDDGTCTACGCSDGECDCCDFDGGTPPTITADVTRLSGHDFGIDGAYTLACFTSSPSCNYSMDLQIDDFCVLLVTVICNVPTFFHSGCGAFTCGLVIRTISPAAQCDLVAASDYPFGDCACNPLNIIYRLTLTATNGCLPCSNAGDFGDTAEYEVVLSL